MAETQPLSARIPAGLKAALVELAKVQGVSLTVVVTEVLKAGLLAIEARGSAPIQAKSIPKGVTYSDEVTKRLDDMAQANHKVACAILGVILQDEGERKQAEHFLDGIFVDGEVK